MPTAIRGVLRDYDWGVLDGLVDWSGVRTGGPQAELWFGSHPFAPSPLIDDPDTSLADAWQDQPAPLLTKLLAAATPLSLQVHPTAERIAQWWSDPAAAALLNDRGEKTEMLIAVEPFLVLAGWRDAQESAAVLRNLGADQAVTDKITGGDRRGAIELLLGPSPLIRAAPDWRDALAHSDPLSARAMAAVLDRFGDDRGVAVAWLLQPQMLQPGDAMFVPAGVAHAYVRGVGVEVMSSSDNVLRLGLTGKTMSVPHALAAIDDQRRPLVIRRPADGIYCPPGAPFEVRMLGEGEVELAAGNFRLVLSLRGECQVTVAGGPGRQMAPGTALAIPTGSPSARVVASGSAVLVTAREEA